MRVGLTGGLACGKSTVAERLRQAGIVVIDADELVAELYRGGEPGAAAVKELFGESFLHADGSVDHAQLAQRVFSDSEALASLEERIHPLVRAALAQRTATSDSPIVVEGTLLVEAGQAADFDLLLTVEASPETQFERAVARGLSPEQARARLDAQGDGELRRRAAHRILINEGSLEELLDEADSLADEIKKRHQEETSR